MMPNIVPINATTCSPPESYRQKNVSSPVSETAQRKKTRETTYRSSGTHVVVVADVLVDAGADAETDKSGGEGEAGRGQGEGEKDRPSREIGCRGSHGDGLEVEVEVEVEVRKSTPGSRS